MKKARFKYEERMAGPIYVIINLKKKKKLRPNFNNFVNLEYVFNTRLFMVNVCLQIIAVCVLRYKYVQIRYKCCNSFIGLFR